MKRKILLGLATIAIIYSAQAQQTTEMVSTGVGYTNSSFYSLENGEVANVSNENWDLAFNTSAYAVDIRINGGKGVELYTYPNGDTTDWMNVDITNIANWTPNYNSNEYWELGAFNVNATGSSGDYGWGTYNSVTHHVTGDSIYVIKTLAGTYKKLWIVSLANGQYNFKYADINNSNEVVESITLANYADKNYFYYSIDNGTVIDREPSAGTWDLVITKYLAAQPQGGYYPSTGVLTNKDLKTREARNVSPATALWGDYTEEDKINVIGYDWKSFNMTTSSYDIVPDLSYFVTDRAGNIWHLVFTGFDGASTGNIYFTKKMISSVSIDEQNTSINIGVYPNPATEQFNLIFDNELGSNTTIKIMDLNGKVVFSQTSNAVGLVNTSISLANFSKGFYTIIVANGEKIGVQKLIVE